MTDVHKLWVTVSCFGEGNLFAVYPRLLAAMVDHAQGSARGPPDFDVLLPSNIEWQTKIYYQLVGKQRENVGMPQPAAFLDRPRSAGPWDTTQPQPPAKRPRTCRHKSESISSQASVASSVAPVTWTVNDIAKAAGLLVDPPMSGVEFGDEQEMRRVYTLIYDVFRYKNVLNQSLTDVSFFYLFPELRENNTHQVWLLLYDLYHRRFCERDHVDGSAGIADKLFPIYGLSVPEAALWATRVRLAASMSRLRIANSALRLSDMLPPHLRDERVVKAVQVAPVMCWVNKNRISGGKSPEDVFMEIKNSMNLQVLEIDSASLGPLDLRWDPLCPMFLSFHHSQRTNLAQSSYVRNHVLIMLNRAFCIGPAIFCKLLLKHNLTGSVIQSHISSPRSTAYFATLLSENDQIVKLLAFGAGNRKSEYEEYFADLKIKNVTVYSQRLVDLEPESSILEHVVAVFVTPPNSYSAVIDPIDLVCSRGGDLSMLEILTDTADSVEGQKRVASILEEQRLTLRYSMTRPQIQFAVYETHSQLSAENEDMVTQVLNEVNRAARYKHAELLGKIHTTTKTENPTSAVSATTLSETEINNNETELKATSLVSLDESVVEEKETDQAIAKQEREEEMIKNIQIPDTDSFIQHDLPDLCFNADHCLSLTQEGCYLALCQRKEVTRFDAKYMIKMAESRGLFGGNSPDQPKTKQKTPKARRKEAASSSSPVKRKRGTFEVERISAHTHSSMMRSCCHDIRTENGEVPLRCCPRHNMDDNRPKVPPARLWWAETQKYLTRLKKSLIRQKLVSNKPAIASVVNNERINKDISNIDEILKNGEHKSNKTVIPPFPRLRLSRSPVKIEREPFPVYIKSVKLDNNSYF